MARLLVAAVMAGVLVAGLLLPYLLGAGLAANKVTKAVESADTSLLDMSKLPLRSTIVDADGNTIAYVYDQDRTYVPLSQISLYLQQAVISIEDRRFFINHGVDWQGTTRALLQDASGKPVQGGSTITQQLVKNYLYLVKAKTPAQKADAIARTPIRKLREAKIALMYDNHHSKNQILEQYLNLVAFGPNTYGAEAASQHFFGVDANRLSLSQAALLAAMINNPNKYNPLVGSQTDVTLARRNKVLDNMYRDNWITKKARNAAKKRSIAEDLNATSISNGCLHAPHHETQGYFCRYVLDYLQDAGVKYDDIARGGYTITATMDPSVMKHAVKAVRKTAAPDDDKTHRVANVMAVVRPGVGTRKVLALAANRPYGLDQDKGQTVQRLTTTFAPLGAGDIFKVFTAAAAMNKGLGIDAKIDVPKKYVSQLVPDYPFKNRGTFPKRMSLGKALIRSPDTPFVKLEDQLGLPAVVKMAVRLGLRGYLLDAGDVSHAFAGIGSSYAKLVPAQKIASFTLGVSPVSPLELAGVGATLDSDGNWCPPTPVASITDRDGHQVSWKHDSCEQAVPRGLARTLTNTLTEDMHHKKGTAHATAKKAKWSGTSASLTGSTSKYKSAAFLGYTPDYSASVMTWDYLNHPRPLCVDPLRTCKLHQAKGGAGLTGNSVPEETWIDAMKPLEKNSAHTLFPPSDPTYLTGTSSSQLPDVKGETYSDAKSVLTAKGFKVADPDFDTDSSAPANTVIGQRPTGATLPGTTVHLKVSAGPTTSGEGDSGGSSSGDSGDSGGLGDDLGGGWSGNSPGGSGGG